MTKRKIAVDLPQDEFIELLSMTTSYLNSPGAKIDCAFTNLMKNLHEQLDLSATDEERDEVRFVNENILEVMSKDSADMYLMKAGMNGVVEQIEERL